MHTCKTLQNSRNNYNLHHMKSSKILQSLENPLFYKAELWLNIFLSYHWTQFFIRKLKNTNLNPLPRSMKEDSNLSFTRENWQKPEQNVFLLLLNTMNIFTNCVMHCTDQPGKKKNGKCCGILRKLFLKGTGKGN